MTSDNKYVYKVVVLKGDKYLSLCSNYIRSKNADTVVCEYRLNEVTKPKIEGSVLYAFDTIAHARGWMKCHVTHGAIFECEYAKDDRPVFIESSITIRNIKRMWSKLKESPLDCLLVMVDSLRERCKFGKSSFYLVQPPRGTVGCKWIKPVKMIETK